MASKAQPEAAKKVDPATITPVAYDVVAMMAIDSVKEKKFVFDSPMSNVGTFTLHHMFLKPAALNHPQFGPYIKNLTGNQYIDHFIINTLGKTGVYKGIELVTGGKESFQAVAARQATIEVGSQILNYTLSTPAKAD